MKNLTACDELTRLNQDEHYRDLWMLKTTLEHVLAQWDSFPTRPLEPDYREILGDHDYIIGDFALTRVKRVRDRINAQTIQKPDSPNR